MSLQPASMYSAQNLALRDITPPPPPAPASLTGPQSLGPQTMGPYRLEATYNPQLAALRGIMPAGVDAAAANAAGGPTFESQVRGQDAQAIDIELAQICQDVYDANGTGTGTWNRVGDAQLSAAGIDPASLENPETGFRAAVYTDGDGRYVLAYAGSNDVQDWINNARQGIGWDAEQYDQAVQLAQQVDAAFGADGNLVITGHSLGGGLAATAALATDTAAVTFNAAGVHDDTLRSLGLDPAQARADAEGGLIRRYNIGGEILTAAQEDVWVVNNLPDAPGHEITLDDPAPPQAPDWTWNPIEMAQRTAEYLAAKAARPLQLHALGPMIDALQGQ